MEKFCSCMIFLLFVGKLSRLYSNSKHLIIKKKKFTGKPSQLEANPRKPWKFSNMNDLHYTVRVSSFEQSYTVWGHNIYNADLTLAFDDHMSFVSSPWLPVNYDIMLFISYTAPVHILKRALSHWEMERKLKSVKFENNQRLLPLINFTAFMI